MKSSLLALTLLALAGCSSGAVTPATSDNGTTPAGETPGGNGGTVIVGGGPSAGGQTSDDGGATTPTPTPTPTPTDDASTPTPTPDDGGAPPSAGGVFADAGPYAATLGPSARNPKHPGNPNPAGQACLTCHGGQKPNIVQFLFAGTVWSSSAATTPVPSAEMRIVQSNGTALSAYSDADGNFFFARGANPALSPPVTGGARDATSVALMSNVFSVGDCNSCHRTGGEAPLHLP